MAKTMNANMGLGDARSEKRRNNRVKQIEQKNWKFKRISFFQRNVRFAAVAKTYRVVYVVTQSEVAKKFGVTQGTVCNWESGKYSWPDGQSELEEYCKVIRAIAN